MRRRNRNTMKKERIIMLASSVFVLTALTMTGFYVKERNKENNDGYLVDMSALEKKTEEKTRSIAQSIEEEELSRQAAQGNDLDYDPYFQEADSGSVKNTWDSASSETGTDVGDGQQNKESKTDGHAQKAEESETGGKSETGESYETGRINKTESEKGTTESTESDEVKETAASAGVKNALVFRERDLLSWPVAGNVLINYSMDKTVYFPTLQQYKYNPAILISATEGESITAAADGRIVSVFEDEEIGRAVTMDIGNGYELTYGQLQDIMVLNGDVINEGDIIGSVSTPTKYYSVEGCNVYFKLTKDGVPVNPMSRLE